jgi:tape measure domain-containing protein
MEDDIEIRIILDESEIDRSAKSIGDKLKRQLNAALGGSAGSETDRVTRTFKDQEAAALKFAQAQARLATAGGDLNKAQGILSTALAKTTRESVAQIGAQTQLIQTQNRAARSTRELGVAMSSLGGRLTLGVSAPLLGLGFAAVKTATDFDSLKRGLVSVAGSSAEAEKQLTRLKEVAKLPGLGFKEAIQGSINLQAAGLSAERSERALKAFGNALATVGKGKSELDGVILALSQIESKGKVSAEEINQLAERVPQIRQIMLKAFGTADTEVIQRAKISSGLFIDAVVTELEKLPKVTGGARNTFENLKDSIEQSLLPLGNKLLSTILPAIERLTPKLLGLLEGFSKLSPEVQSLVIGFGAAAIAAGPFIGALGNILGLLTQIRNLGGVTSVLGGVGGSIGRVGAFLGAGAGVGLGVAGLAGAGFGISTALSERDLNQRIAALQHNFQLQQGNRPFFDPEAEAARVAASGTLGSAKPLTGPIRLGTSTLGVDPVTGRSVTGGPTDNPLIDAQELAKKNAKAQGQKTELQKATENVKDLSERVAALRSGEGKLFAELVELAKLRIQSKLLNEQLEDATFKAAKTSLGIPLAPELPAIGLPTVPLTARGGAAGITGFPSLVNRGDIEAENLDVNQKREALADQRLRLQETQIQNQVNRGILTEAQAQQQLAGARRAARDELIASLDAQLQAVGANSIAGLQIQEQIERLRFMGVELTNVERFARGFGSAMDTVGDAFERFGQNVSRALTNTKDLLNGLKNSVLQLFNDLVGQGLQNLVRSALAPLLGLGGGGGVGGGGGIGGIFRTPSTFPAQIAQAFAGGGSGSISAPPSISLGPFGFGNGFNIFSGGGGGSSSAKSPIDEFIGASVPRTAGKINFLSGIGRSIASAAPFLGLGLGGSLGGQSITGQILGSAGGFLGGAALAAAVTPGIFSAGALALFSNPITAIAGAGLLVGGLLLSKASQRKKDEEASGQFLTQALQGIEQLATAVATDQLEGSQARAVFDTQILGTFRQQISGLKTKSVVESRLKNQVNDLNKVYEARIVPLISEQQKRRDDAVKLSADQARFLAFDRRLVPQFEIGGMSHGGLALLHANEMVLTPTHQRDIRTIAGPDIFDRVGVPGIQNPPIFDYGGLMPSGGQSPTIVIEKIVLYHGMSESGAEELVAVGMKGRRGENIVASALEAIRTRRK